ncbi:hypothetical protein MF271_19860 (plasmid) [Deinococcus sp. KNUC1210]|uniref:hypothetical protein n=1 Tax=Deinococcus sp. KNUC1210 TaxID=2917691 RepID=UPI001EF12CBD|nr:hypothetical protein [Deinococcus sp. KNUC1210]ULH17670.1 hypothetical protein MF271_19860 [Deinococcus sp. KNUC1210]
MKASLEPIKVQTDPQGRPQRFQCCHRMSTVTALVEGWLYSGQWWLPERPRQCYWVEAEDLQRSYPSRTSQEVGGGWRPIQD